MLLVAMAITNMATAMVAMGMAMGMVQENKTRDCGLLTTNCNHSHGLSTNLPSANLASFFEILLALSRM